ncbi:hypothetical protein [Nocardiopsis dassonvillei]|uniref:Uncharacterized protein n=1 Tax=Nocardiopsis dassonvillei (strain ATCC 23218 / DSM 43111 / CIP 107115 / JCM 7437 / KCTC 9190 / NBRC 14626 / NCTC 10488 / NRRL B-5397 / IMRU 509) TaxID=446468 RepID=D7B9S3_NOCDD|nr:hypothetical protein [Nocardiopsis dassonvillei]ADH70931.1 hypothetical protein Ndas_5552 [Nocardiopsis dassonvillei subsp. dassonvillei DSM 43111]NKY79757.1 hypothetical protein [Nocardiopsis dassonvillei]VEI91139.1 Uncharacterised protein [Nocardiopsis dassonvillei]
MTEQGPDLVRFLLSLLTVVLPPLLAGVLALVLAQRAPGGRGFVRTGGGLLALLSVVQGARELWFRFLFLPSLVENGEVPVPFPALFALDIGVHVLLAVALVLLLCAVISSRGRRHAPRGTVPRRPEQRPEPRGGRPGGAPYGGGRSSAHASNAHTATGDPGHRGDAFDGGGGHHDGGGGGHNGGGADGGGGGGGF